MTKIFKLFRLHEWILFSLMLIAVIGQVACTLTLPDYMSDIVADITGASKSASRIWRDGLIMVGIAGLNALCAMISNLLSAKLSADFTAHLREIVFKKVESFSMEEINRFSTASLITRSTNDIQQIANVFSMGFKFLLMCPLMATYAIIKIIGRSHELSLVTAGGVLLLAIFIAVAFVLVMPKFKFIQRLVDKTNGVMRENLIGLRVIRAYNAEQYQEKKFEKINNELTSTSLFINRIMTLMDPLMMFIQNGLNLTIMWFGAYLINKNALSLPVMTAFSMYATHVIMSFMFITVVSVMFPRAIVSAKRVSEILDSKNLILDPEDPKQASTKGCVEFKNVSFKFHDGSSNVLSNISFSASKGETVAIVGGTGSGKSALINLIPRFYDVTEGEVLVDGVNVKDYRQADLRDKIGYVSQKAIMFSGTIRSNVTFGSDDISEAEIKKATEIAQASEFISQRQEGLDAHTAQGGANLSGGQKQRLSIARAIAKNPEIYIFDDSFSALDYKTDKLLRKALKNYTTEATSIIVAQRIGTVVGADKILVLDEGRLVGMGTHSELLKSCEVYRQIAYSQLSKEELENAT